MLGPSFEEKLMFVNKEIYMFNVKCEHFCKAEIHFRRKPCLSQPHLLRDSAEKKANKYNRDED